MSRLPPGPPRSLRLLAHYLRTPYRFFDELQRRHGQVFTVDFPTGRVVYIAEPRWIQEVWRKDQAGELTILDRGFLGPVFGERSIVATADVVHERQRRLFLPQFHGARMRAFGELIRAEARAMTASWRPGEALALHPAMIELSLSVTLAVILGIRDPGRIAVYRAALRPLFDRLGPLLLFVPKLRIDLGRLSPWGRFVAAKRRFRALVAEEIVDRRARAGERCDDVLDLLLAAEDEDGRPLGDEELQAHVLTLLVLGHETTASALAWGLCAIYRDPTIVDRIRAEVASLPADAGSDAIAGLPYVGAVCDEILRIRPVVPEVRRRLLRTPWAIDGWSLPAGVLLAPCVYLLHRHPALYPDPDAFRPDRFLDRRFTGHEYMPFGGGIRRCTGASFARYEMILVVATIVAAADLKVHDEAITVRRANLAVIPSTGARVTVRAVTTA